MKISLLIESSKPADEAVREIKDMLSSAGYDVAITWPDLEPLIKRVSKVRSDIKKIK